MWYISSFYNFRSINRSARASSEAGNNSLKGEHSARNPSFDATLETSMWQSWVKNFKLRGLLILGVEGFNSTVASESEDRLKSFKSELVRHYQCQDMLFKDSKSEISPFTQFKIKIRPEIVTLGAPELVPTQRHRHLTPEQWHQALESKEGVVIDTRNWYEYRLGTFKNAINPNIEQFSEFPKFMQAEGIRKNQKIFIFCTGGIRCEKGILELERQGYHNVYQLEGGILNYLQKYPDGQFEGECFVFDNRVAVDKNLAPTKIYSFCPHCGQPAEIKKVCVQCGKNFKICPICLEKAVIQETCSKNCAHHHRRLLAAKHVNQNRFST